MGGKRTFRYRNFETFSPSAFARTLIDSYLRVIDFEIALSDTPSLCRMRALQVLRLPAGSGKPLGQHPCGVNRPILLQRRCD